MEENKIIRIASTKGKNPIPIGAKKQLICLKVGEQDTVEEKHGRKVKWIGIAVEYIAEVKELSGDVVSNKWSTWKKKKTEKILKYGIGKQYGFGNSIKTKTMSADDMLEGTIYYYEPFIDEPNFEGGRYIAAIGEEPKILSAYFSRYKRGFLYPDGSNSDVFTYKSSIRLHIETHLIPNYTVAHHNFALFEITICDTDGNTVTEEPIKYYQKHKPDSFATNTFTEIDIEINEAWKKKSNHEKNTIKTYYAKINTILYSNEDTFTGSAVDDIEDKYLISANENPKNNGLLKFTNKFKSVAPNKDLVGVIYTDEDEMVSDGGRFWGRNVEKGKANAAKYTQEKFGEHDTRTSIVYEEGQLTEFKVKWAEMDLILENYEARKENMFVVVGDEEYTEMSNEPCKFSKITVAHKSRKKPFILFEEKQKTKKVDDKTDLIFGLVAGEEKEIITIKAEGLEIQDKHSGDNPPRCFGITTVNTGKKNKKAKHKDEEFKHNSIEDVFMMDYAYRLDKNKTTKDNYKIGITEQNVDHEHNKQDNSIELRMHYYYDKTIDTRIERFVGKKASEWTNKLISSFWMFRYFFLTDKQAQIYFVPISTCRYPNQKAIIKVYPKIAWSFVISFGKAAHKHQEEWQKELSEEKKELVKDLKDDISYIRKAALTRGGVRRNLKSLTEEEKKEEDLAKINFGFSLGAKFDKETINFTPDLGKKIKDYIHKFAVAKNLIDEITGNGHSKEKQQNLYQNRVRKLSKKHGKKWLKKLVKAPVTITVHEPSFSTGFAWSRSMFEHSQESAQALIAYDIFLKASPLFKLEGSLDLITCATFIPFAGQIINVADIVLNVVGVEPVFKITGEGSIGCEIKGTIKHSSSANVYEDNLSREFSAGLKITVEASITISAGLVGFMFAGGDIKGFVTDSTYTAYAETGFEATLGSGVNLTKGPYISANVVFTGLFAVGKKGTSRDGFGSTSEEAFRYTIIGHTKFIDDAKLYF